MQQQLLHSVVNELFTIGAVKFGTFKLKSGAMSPVYVDMRMLNAYPGLLSNVADLLHMRIQSLIAEHNLPTKVRLCGVPFAALTLATAISVKHQLPSLLVRKEAKAHGTANLIEGIVSGINHKEESLIIVEDVVTSGLSITEIVQKIQEPPASLKATAAVCFLDREQNGPQNLMQNCGLKLGSVVTMRQINNILNENSKIALPQPQAQPQVKQQQELSFSERAQHCQNGFGKALFKLMESKQTNLSVAVDVCTMSELLQIAEQVGPEICLLKTHIDMVKDFNAEQLEQLCQLAQKHQFYIFEDRKFADIGKVAKEQYSSGVYKISQWSHLTNAHMVSGPAIVKALREGLPAQQANERGLLLIAQMSSEGALKLDLEQVWRVAKENADFVCGFICQEQFTSKLQAQDKDEKLRHQQFIYMTPGVNLQDAGDRLGQQYNTPASVVAKGADVIIVGTGIVQAKDRLAEAKRYREAGWKAYKERVGK